MHHHYSDIRDTMAAQGSEPRWWDECGVPRYCEFSPGETNNIYARQVVLAEIACQDCDTRFKVAFSYSHGFDGSTPLDECVRDDTLHYGDPPNVGCCPAGPTMNSVPIRVIEFWDLTDFRDVHRVAELEREIKCAWAGR